MPVARQRACVFSVALAIFIFMIKLIKYEIDIVSMIVTVILIVTLNIGKKTHEIQSFFSPVAVYVIYVLIPTIIFPFNFEMWNTA